MSALEREIIGGGRHLQPEAKRCVLETLSSDMQIAFDYAAWRAQVEALQEGIRSRIGDNAAVGTLSLLDELRGDFG